MNIFYLSTEHGVRVLFIFLKRVLEYFSQLLLSACFSLFSRYFKDWFYSKLDFFNINIKHFFAVDSSPPAANTNLLVISLGSDINSSAVMVDSLGLNYLDIIKHTKTVMIYFLLCRKETAEALLVSFVFLRKWCWEKKLFLSELKVVLCFVVHFLGA